MNRAQHRKEAERLLSGVSPQLDILEKTAQRGMSTDNGMIGIGIVNITIAKAHVHALLAQGEDPVDHRGLGYM